MCAIVCVVASASFETANAARAGRAVCEPALPGRICPPLQFSRCVPCKLKGGAPGCSWTPSSRIKSRYYLRFTIADRPGVLARLAHVLGEHGISIASVIQHDPGDDAPPDAPVALVMMTHAVVEAEVFAAFATIDRLDVVRQPSVCLGVED